MQFVTRSLAMLRVLLQRFGPYLIVEMVLPGGTLIALLLYWYQRRKRAAGSATAQSPLAAARAPA
ncbi:MAG: hypothetical protein ACREYD_11270 [Casimicrobiaceae bacterium]